MLNKQQIDKFLDFNHPVHIPNKLQELIQEAWGEYDLANLARDISEFTTELTETAKVASERKNTVNEFFQYLGKDGDADKQKQGIVESLDKIQVIIKSLKNDKGESSLRGLRSRKAIQEMIEKHNRHRDRIIELMSGKGSELDFWYPVQRADQAIIITLLWILKKFGTEDFIDTFPIGELKGEKEA